MGTPAVFLYEVILCCWPTFLDASNVRTIGKNGRVTCFRKESLLIFDLVSMTIRSRIRVIRDVVLRAAWNGMVELWRGDISSTKVFQLGAQYDMYSFQ
ncbi:MAG: hypothetical protein ACXV45_05480 [Halobacteriota archaeon]